MKTKIIFLVSILGLVACGINEGIIQKSERGYIEFSGNLQGVVAQIDDGEPFNVALNVYQLSNGKHRVKVFRDNRLIVDRMLFIDDQTRLEVQIP